MRQDAERRDVANRVVVGVDGSEDAAAALSWAVEEARVRGGTLHAVYTWSIPAVALPYLPEVRW